MITSRRPSISSRRKKLAPTPHDAINHSYQLALPCLPAAYLIKLTSLPDRGLDVGPACDTLAFEPCSTSASKLFFVKSYLMRTLSNDSFLTAIPAIDDLTLRLNPSLFERKSSAAILFRGSDALGSRKRNYTSLVRVQNAKGTAAYLQANDDCVEIKYRLPIFS